MECLAIYTHLYRNFECIIKMTKSGFGYWKMYVKYLIKKNPGVPLKKLITGYNKKEYEKFKKDPKLFV